MKKKKEETKEEKEKIPHMCESIGYRPLRGCCPKTTRNISTSDAGAKHPPPHPLLTRHLKWALSHFPT